MKFTLPTITFIILFTFCNNTVQAQEITSEVAALELPDKFQYVRDFAMTSTAKEAYITIQSPLAELSVLVQLKKINNKWTDSKIMPFSGQYNDMEPFLSNNDLRLYFASNRPVSDTIKKAKDFDIWYVEREHLNAKWGTPINMGAPINTNYDEFYPSVANNNNLYFTSNYPNSKGKDDIYCSTWKNSKYTSPVSLSDAINTAGYEFNAYIAPDETFLIFSAYNRKDGFGSGDLYISYRKEDDLWAKAVNLGNKVNSKQMDYCPFINSQSMQLYFTSKRSDFSTAYNFESIKSVLKAINKAENGLTKIYNVSLKTKLKK